MFCFSSACPQGLTRLQVDSHEILCLILLLKSAEKNTDFGKIGQKISGTLREDLSTFVFLVTV